MIDPLESHVFAVGISSYDLGPSWRLPNAADHALEFAARARSRRVPRHQVHLFLSTADQPRLAAKIAAADVDVRRATFVEITDFATRTLTTKHGNLLYMFWAGHGSVSEDGGRVLFFEDISDRTPLPFDLNDFFARLRTVSFQRFRRQVAFIDACANRFEELGFDASLGQVKAGKARYSHEGVRQSFFLAADSGEQAQEGAFGAAVLKALEDETARRNEWPPDQDAIVNAVRPQFENAGQHPVQLVWTTGDGDLYAVERTSGELPASRFVNAAAFARRLPVRALRRLADIALQYGELGQASGGGATQRDSMYATLCGAAGRPQAKLMRSTPRVEMLHLVGAALQWNHEDLLAGELGRLAPAAEFCVELERLALIQEVRTVIGGLPANAATLHDEFLKTISHLSQEAARDDASTVDAMLDELYQISAASDPQRPLWEFLLRLSDRYPKHRTEIEAFVKSRGATALTVEAVQQKLRQEQQFVLSINVIPADTDEPAVHSVDGRLVVAGTSNVVRTFPAQRVDDWEDADAYVASIVRESRVKVMKEFRRNESALLIEFLMPAAFLCRAPDQLPVRLGTRSQPLGSLHPVVVRLRERIAQREDAVNLEEWTTIASRIDRDAPSVVQWMERSRESPTIETCQGLVALRFLPADDLFEIVCDGFPFMAWLRCEPQGGDWTAFTQQFEMWVSRKPLKKLVREVRGIRRRTADLGANLTLFWDDPQEADYWFRLDEVIGDV